MTLDLQNAMLNVGKRKPRGKPFQKGNKGGGRPKKNANLRIPDILERLLSDEMPKELLDAIKNPWLRSSPTFREALMKNVIMLAMKGESWALQYVSERTEGKAKEYIEIDNKGGNSGPLVMVLAQPAIRAAPQPAAIDVEPEPQKQIEPKKEQTK